MIHYFLFSIPNEIAQHPRLLGRGKISILGIVCLAAYSGKKCSLSTGPIKCIPIKREHLPEYTLHLSNTGVRHRK